MIKKYPKPEQRTLLGNKQNSFSFASHPFVTTYTHFGFSEFLKKNKNDFTTVGCQSCTAQLEVNE